MGSMHSDIVRDNDSLWLMMMWGVCVRSNVMSSVSDIRAITSNYQHVMVVESVEL